MVDHDDEEGEKKGREEDAHKGQSLFDVMNARYHVFTFAPGCLCIALFDYLSQFLISNTF